MVEKWVGNKAIKMIEVLKINLNNNFSKTKMCISI